MQTYTSTHYLPVFISGLSSFENDKQNILLLRFNAHINIEINNMDLTYANFNVEYSLSIEIYDFVLIDAYISLEINNMDLIYINSNVEYCLSIEIYDSIL